MLILKQVCRDKENFDTKVILALSEYYNHAFKRLNKKINAE